MVGDTPRRGHDPKVMTIPSCRMSRDPTPSARMTLGDDTEIFVLDEFRLRVADTDGSAAALVLAGAGSTQDPVPLLTSIDDACDVASLRAVRAGAPEGEGPRSDVALGRLVA